MGNEFYYPDEFYPGAEELAEIVGAGLIGILLVLGFVLLVLFAVSAAMYVLQSIGLYTIAKRRKIHHSWLAWIPLGNMWILGSISDQYQYVVKGEIKNRRRQLLWLTIGLVVLYIMWIACDVVSTMAGGPIPGYWVCLIAMAIFPTIQTIIRYFAYYDLYYSCVKDNAVWYLVLSIICPVTLPFLIFFSRKKEKGMPPRKDTRVPQEPVVEAELAQPVNDYPTEPENAYPTEPENAYPTEPVEEDFAQPEDFEEESEKESEE